MSTGHPPPFRAIRWARPGVAIVIAVLASLAVSPAVASGAARSAPVAPQLSIDVDDGERSAKAGDELSYTLTVRNLGATKLTGLHVTQTVPVGLKPSTTDPKGIVERRSVTWSVDLPANGSVQLRTVATVSETPDAVLRLASVGCAALSADDPPLVCASDSDLLPAGRAAKIEEAGAHPADEPSAGTRAPSSGRNMLPFVVAGGIAALLLVGAVAVASKRRHLAVAPTGARSRPRSCWTRRPRTGEEPDTSE